MKQQDPRKFVSGPIEWGNGGPSESTPDLIPTDSEVSAEAERRNLVEVKAAMVADRLCRAGHIGMGEVRSFAEKLVEAYRNPRTIDVDNGQGGELELDYGDYLVRDLVEFAPARAKKMQEQHARQQAEQRAREREPHLKGARAILEQAKLRGESFTSEQYEKYVREIADRLELQRKSGSWMHEDQMLVELRKRGSLKP